MLSKQEALQFVIEILKISQPLEKLQEDRLAFLNEIIEAFYHEIPFQNLTLMAAPLQERKKPDWKEIKRELFLRRGGLCYTMNVFMKYLLEALSYTCYHARANVFSPGDHAIVLLENVVNLGDHYYVDAGCGHPTLEAISLDFNTESPVYTHLYLHFKLVRKGNTFVREHSQVDACDLCVNITKEWSYFLSFEYVPVDLSMFEESMTKAYTIPEDSGFIHFSPRIVNFQREELVYFKDGAINIIDVKSKKWDKLLYKSIEEIIYAIREQFPQYNEEEIKHALLAAKNLKYFLS